MEILKVENLTKTYGSGENLVHAVDDVSFSVEKGEFVAIVGASGSGKLNIIPFYFDHTVMPSVIIKNIIFKICLFIPVGYMLFTKKQNQIQIVKILLLIGFLKETFHLLILYGYFDITDILYYLVGGLIGYYIHKIIFNFLLNK